MTHNRSLAVLLVLAAVLVGLMLVLLAPFIQPISFAVILAVAFQPAYSRVARQIRRPALAALIVTLMIVLLVLTPLWLLGGILIGEARTVYHNLAAQSIQEGGWSGYAARLLAGPVEWGARQTGAAAPDVRAALLDRAQALSALLVKWSGSLLGNLTTTIGSGLLSLFVLFYLFLEGRAITAGICHWMPLPEARTRELLQAVADSIVANLYGIVAVGSVQGTLTGVGFVIAGLGSPVLWGVVAGVCSLVPIVGTAAVWAPGAIFLLVQGAWGKALFLAV